MQRPSPPPATALQPEQKQPARPLLDVRDLHVEFNSDEGIVRAVDGVSFSLARGETLGIVGESGSGKSAMSLAMLGLSPPTGRVTRGAALLHGDDLLAMGAEPLAQVRGNRIAMIFQDPMTSLNPFLTIAEQLTEVTRLHLHLSRKQALEHAVDLMGRVGIPAARRRVFDYPHQFSGGMRQRVMIAMALACKPDVLIADEPTTALDVTIQAQILELMRRLQQDEGTAILLITHDLGVVAEVCDRVNVMYAGRFVEQATTQQLFRRPRHPYTLGLLGSIPRAQGQLADRLVSIPGQPPHLAHLDAGCAFAPRCAFSVEDCRREQPPLRQSPERGRYACLVDIHQERPASVVAKGVPKPTSKVHAGDSPLLELHDLRVHFEFKRGSLFNRRRVIVRAVDGLSMHVNAGETLGLVGESGSGKSTAARTIVGLNEPSGGEIRFAGVDVETFGRAEWRQYRRDVQMIFQDPFASLNPRMTVGRIIAEPLKIFRVGSPRERKAEVLRLMELVGLNPRSMNRYPHEFSGGQRQRIGIARALALSPRLIVCDEPVSALDVSIQAQVINLLMDLQQRLGLAYVFIAHDLSIVRHVSQRVGVMYAGRLVELAETNELFANPRHPYTQALLSAAPVADPATGRKRIVLEGEPPAPDEPRVGCPFAERCPVAEFQCLQITPPLAGKMHQAACWLVNEETLR